MPERKIFLPVGSGQKRLLNFYDRDSLPFGMHGVGDSIANHVLQEDFQDAAGLFVDQAGESS